MSFPRNSSSLRDRRRASPYRGLAPVRPAGLRPRGLPPAGSGPAGLRGGAGRPAWPPRSLPRRILASCARLRKLDWILLAAVLALGLVGTLLVWSATQPSLLQAGADPRAYLKKQLLNIGLGLILMLAVSTLDYRQLRLLAPIGYGLSCLGLVVVLTPLGSVVNGAHSWISLPGGFQLEPSEYAKLSIVVVAAMILGELRPGDDRPRMRAVMAAVACSAVPLILVVLQPDLGVTILMMTMLAGLVVLSGIRLRWLAALAAAGGAGAVAAVNLHLLKSYQLSRLTSFMNPSADPRGTGYSAAQSKIAIGSGGLLGHGLFHGPLTAGNFVPEQHTDFIFTAVGEELGFLGGAALLALFAIVIWRTWRAALLARDFFGTLVCIGVLAMFMFQIFENIGMTMGIMPVTGIPLPFMSYGGSSTITAFACIALVANVSMRRFS